MAAQSVHSYSSPSFTSSASQLVSASSSNLTGYSPMFRSVLSAKRKSNSYCLKVTLAKKSGNKVTDPSRQTYMTVNDVTANVPYITTLCKKEFQNNSLILVSANGLPIEDNDATKGLAFWKANFRKVFAIPAPVKKERSIVCVDDDLTNSDNSDIAVESDNTRKIMVKEAVVDGVNQVFPKAVQSFQESMEKAIKAHFSQEAFMVKAVQNALLEEVHECLECIICKETSRSPVIVATCCESVIGCHECSKFTY